MTSVAAALTTPRLRLVPATGALVAAELDGLGKLAPLLDADIYKGPAGRGYGRDRLRGGAIVSAARAGYRGMWGAD
jgi:hypothetical protein